MAPLLGRKKLVCFYCGRRSGLKQNGFIREWECQNCEAVNYLDENGDITDPPVATTSEAPVILQYAHALPQAASPSSNPDDTLFCEDCLKNQHMFTASLAQYTPDDDKILYDRNYYKYRNDLEKRYPQVCSDCEAGVLERIKQAGYTAKTDHLRRLMDKTRTKKASKSTTSWTQLFQTWGGMFWWAGLAGQIIWNVLGILYYLALHSTILYSSEVINHESILLDELDRFGVGHSSQAVLTSVSYWVQDNYIRKVEHVSVPVSTLTLWSLILSVISIWWNPKYRHMVRGFDSQIIGFSDWYKYQIILVMTRALFRSLMGTGAFSDAGAPATLGAHIFMLGFMIFVAISAQRSIKVDITPLFAPTPERLRPYVQHKERSEGANLASALSDIAEEKPGLLAAQQDYEFDLSPIGLSPQGARRDDNFWNPGSLRAPTAVTLPGLDEAPMLSAMNPAEAHDYLLTGNIPERLKRQDEEEMEWDPTPSHSFQIARPPRDSQSFGLPDLTPPAPQPSPFWYKVPPAPITPAQRLRNPPNQPRLQPRTQEAKQNFFERMTSESYSEPLGIVSKEARPRRQEIEFSQQKFFPPATAADNMLNSLSDFMGKVQLKSESEAGPDPSKSVLIETTTSRRWRHILTAIVLTFALLGWNHAYTHLIYAVNIELAVMILCAVIALRSITDFTITTWTKNNPPIMNVLGATLAGIETATAGYGILEIMTGNTHCEACKTCGAVLVCVMLVQEVWLAAFGSV